MIRYFEDNFHASYNIRDPRTNATHVVDNWPSIMFAELATNCILHKEYSKHNCVEISVFRDHISFINHNRPLPPVTIEDLNTETEFKDRKYLNEELKEMFFNLQLIQSYGSGIRRAKNALKQIGSPDLVFEPENDTDDYTLVTAYINGKFAGIHKEEAELQVASAQEITQEITQEIAQEKDKKTIIQDSIVRLMIEKPEITTKEIAFRLGLTSDNVKYRIRIMRESGIIEHQGSTKAGRWVIL